MRESIIENLSEIKLESKKYGNKAINLGLISGEKVRVPNSWVINSEYISNILVDYGFKSKRKNFDIWYNISPSSRIDL